MGNFTLMPLFKADFGHHLQTCWDWSLTSVGRIPNALGHSIW